MSKRAKADGLVAVRVAHERAWAYARWLERLSWEQMRIAAALPPERGGLGYDLSKQALHGLVAQARAEAGDMSMGADERRERQLVEADGLARAARLDLDAAYMTARALDAAIADLKDNGQIIDIGDAAILGRLVDQRKGVSRELEAAQRRLSDALKIEREVVAGLAAAAQIEAKIDVTTRDAVTEELNAMLARAGRPPIERVTP